jgi:phosphate uptake regulator
MVIMSWRMRSIQSGVKRRLRVQSRWSRDDGRVGDELINSGTRRLLRDVTDDEELRAAGNWAAFVAGAAIPAVDEEAGS